jgi:hypothetical protein
LTEDYAEGWIGFEGHRVRVTEELEAERFGRGAPSGAPFKPSSFVIPNRLQWVRDLLFDFFQQADSFLVAAALLRKKRVPSAAKAIV